MQKQIIKHKKKLWFAVAFGFIAAFFYAKGDKLTNSLALMTTFFGAFSVPDLGIMVGIFLGIITYFTTLYFKIVNRRSLLKNLNAGRVGALLNEEDT